MFGRQKQEPTRAARSIPSDVAISRYGEILAARNGPIEDLRDLGADKKFFKQAILHRLSTISEKAEKQILLDGYLMLSTFQPLTAAEKEIVRVYGELMSNRPAENLANEADRIRMAQFMTIAPAYNSLLDKVLLEREALSQELQSAGVL